jgi:hypothetical protein
MSMDTAMDTERIGFPRIARNLLGRFSPRMREEEAEWKTSVDVLGWY